MNTEEKKEKIKELISDMLKDSYEAMMKKAEIALKSGSIDIDSWDSSNAPMLLPKIIVTAVLESETVQYSGKGTCYEKMIKKEVRNLRYFV